MLKEEEALNLGVFVYGREEQSMEEGKMIKLHLQFFKLKVIE